MFIFILVNVCLGLLLKNDSSSTTLFSSSYFHYAGAFLVIINFIATWIKTKKIPFTLRYDLFAVGSIIICFSYWPPFFREGSPLFYALPFYFSFIAAFFTLITGNKENSLVQDEANQMHRLPNFVFSSPIIIKICVMVSLALPQHFMLFPIAMTLLVARFSLASYLRSS